MNMRISRSISILIILMMILAMLPAGVFADGDAPAPEAPAAVEEAEQEEAPAEEEEAEEEPEEESEEEEPEEEAEEEPEEESKEEEPSPTVVEDDDTTEATVIEVTAVEDSDTAEITKEEESEDEEFEEKASNTVVDDTDTAEITVVEDNKSDEPAPAAAPAGDEDDSNAFDEADYVCKGTAKANAIIRSEPVWNAEILLTVEEETDLKVLEFTSEEWYNVILDDEDCTEGYIYSQHVELEDEEPVAEENETPAPAENKDEIVEEKNEPDEEDDELTEIDDYETPLGLAGMIEVTEDADSTEAAEEAEVTVTEDEDTSEIEEAEVTVTEDEDTSEYTDELLPGTIKIGAAVRTEPDGMSPIILNVTADTALTVLAQVDDDWTAVLLEEEVEGYTIGYVYKDDIVTVTVTEPEKTTEPDEGEEEETETPKKVTIFTSRRVVMEEGENVTLTSKLEGFEGLELMYIWKVDKGEGFEEVEGANASTYTFEATAETLSWGWHLTVLYR